MDHFFQFCIYGDASSTNENTQIFIVKAYKTHYNFSLICSLFFSSLEIKNKEIRNCVGSGESSRASGNFPSVVFLFQLRLLIFLYHLQSFQCAFALSYIKCIMFNVLTSS